MTEEVWSIENAQQLVQKYMRVCRGMCDYTNERDEVVEAAHIYAEQQRTSTQEEYAVAFAKGLYEYAVKLFGEQAVKTYIACLHQEEARNYVAANTPQVKNNPLLRPAQKTVEEWEAEGLRFRPAVSTVVLAPVQEPQDHTPKRRSLEHAMAIERESVATRENAPWGKSAAKMAEWAWEIATGRKISVNQRTVIADVLSVLHHAGILPEGSIIPVGFGHKADVRGTRKQK